MNKVLITSVSRKVQLVMSFKEAGWTVVGQDIDKDAVALKFCDEQFVGNVNDVNGYGIDLLIPTRDAELIDLYDWEINYGAQLETIETCLDKFKFYEWCKKNNIKTPEVHFVKPRISKSGKETECVWQEFINAEEFSIDLFADFESNVISVVPRKRIQIINGESWISETIENEKILNGALELASKLKLVGHNVLQCFLVHGEPVWTEVNLRFGGASALALKAGCESPLWLRKIIGGEVIQPKIGEYKKGLKMFSYKESIFI